MLNFSSRNLGRIRLYDMLYSAAGIALHAFFILKEAHLQRRCRSEVAHGVGSVRQAHAEGRAAGAPCCRLRLQGTAVGCSPGRQHGCPVSDLLCRCVLDRSARTRLVSTADGPLRLRDMPILSRQYKTTRAE